MIKTELIKDDNGNTLLFFEASKQEEQDTLDEILRVLTDALPRRGAYVLGAPNLTLRIEINTK